MSKKTILMAFLFFLLIAISSFFELFYAADRYLMDLVYQVPSQTSKKIKIIGVDEKTLEAYGPFHTWSREKTAQLIALLDETEESSPAVIGLDIMFQGDGEAQADEALARACKEAGNVVAAVNIVYKTVLEANGEGRLQENKLHIEMAEKPYERLLSEVSPGFVNTIQDRDGLIRRSVAYQEYEEEVIDSFPLRLYSLYCKQQSIPLSLPRLDEYDRYAFTYSGKSGSYEVVSMVDVLDKTVDKRVFGDSILLIGAYAPGMMDSFQTPIDRTRQMYGVEVHANILEALMEGKTVLPVNPYISAVLFAAMGVLFYFISRKVKPIAGAVVLVVMIGLELLAGLICYEAGFELPLVTLPVFITLLYLFWLIRHYLTERSKRKQVVKAFKKYVAPQIVDEISKSGEFQLILGGESRDIACLFVDIRGFTPMSESLEPRQVVEILNEYLSLTTNAIFHHNGTLDKFIGDAAMAVFNAPFDLEDYVYQAVSTAMEIAAGSEALEKGLMERFGKSVSFGIGVHCGPAVVGNIGCDFRMDYTAIGDTVNTAARLESNAKKGQILISEAVYEAVKGRIEAEPIGVIPLKGKVNGVMVYSVTTAGKGLNTVQQDIFNRRYC